MSRAMLRCASQVDDMELSFASFTFAAAIEENEAEEEDDVDNDQFDMSDDGEADDAVFNMEMEDEAKAEMMSIKSMVSNASMNGMKGMNDDINDDMDSDDGLLSVMAMRRAYLADDADVSDDDEADEADEADWDDFADVDIAAQRNASNDDNDEKWDIDDNFFAEVAQVAQVGEEESAMKEQLQHLQHLQHLQQQSEQSSRQSMKMFHSSFLNKSAMMMPSSAITADSLHYVGPPVPAVPAVPPPFPPPFTSLDEGKRRKKSSKVVDFDVLTLKTPIRKIIDKIPDTLHLSESDMHLKLKTKFESNLLDAISKLAEIGIKANQLNKSVQNKNNLDDFKEVLTSLSTRNKSRAGGSSSTSTSGPATLRSGTARDSLRSKQIEHEMGDSSYNFDNFELITRNDWHMIARAVWYNEWKRIDTYSHYFQQISYDKFVDTIFSMVQRLVRHQSNPMLLELYEPVTREEMFTHLKVIYILLTESDVTARNELFSRLPAYAKYLERSRKDSLDEMEDLPEDLDGFEINDTSQVNGIGAREFFYVFKSLLNITDDGTIRMKHADSTSVFDPKIGVIPVRIIKVLQLAFLQVGLFYRLKIWLRVAHRDDVNGESVNSSLNEIIDCYHNYYDLIPFNFVDRTEKSLFHLCVIYNIPTFFSLLLRACKLQNINVSDRVDDRGISVTEMAVKYGRWEIFEKILYSKMGDKMREKADFERSKFDKQNGVVRQFLNETNENSNYKDSTECMQFLLSIMIELIEKRRPLSDDLLLLLWNWELKQTEDPFKTRLWQAVNKACDQVLKLPLNQKDWLWFSSYLFNSAIWYQKTQFVPKHKQQAAAIENKADDDSGGFLFCSCGAEMECTLPGVVYDFGAKCNICGRSITPSDYFWHCPVGRNAMHPDTRGGYDYCQSCAQEKIDKMKLLNQMNQEDILYRTLHNNLALAQNDTNNDSERSSSSSLGAVTGAVLMYDKLVQTSQKHAKTSKDYLKEQMNAILESDDRTEKDALDQIVKMTPSVVVDPKIGLRQDSLIAVDTNEELLRYPNIPQFTNKMLKDVELTMQSQSKNSEINIRNHFDANGYLSQLIVKAHAIDYQFHSTMCDILGVKFSTMQNRDLKVSYRKGPVKKIDRCQAKAETKYSSKHFPNSACICDFVRCALCFDDCVSLLNGLEMIKSRVAQGDTCLKKIVRVKNLFDENKRKSGGLDRDWLYRYADIKLNILVESKELRISLICEVQLLLNFMSVSKDLQHHIYEIERHSEFVNDLSRIFDLSANKYQQLLFNVNSNSSSNLKIAQLLLAYYDEIDLCQFDKSGMSPVHYVCKKGLNQTLQLFLDCVSSSSDANKLKQIVNLRANATYGYTPLLYACRHGRNECIRTLLENKHLDINVRDQDGNSPVTVALSKSHGMSVSLVRNDSRYQELESNDPLLLAITTGSVDFLRELLNDKKMKFVQSDAANDANDGDKFEFDDENSPSSNVPIIASVLSNKDQAKEIFTMLLNDPRTDVTTLTPRTRCNALILAASKNDLEMVKTLVDTRKFDLNHQTTHGVSALIAPLLDKPKKNTLSILNLLLQQSEVDPTKPSEPDKLSMGYDAINIGKNIDIRGKTLLDFIVLKTFEPALRLLLKRNDVMSHFGVVTEALVTAAQVGKQADPYDPQVTDKTLQLVQKIYENYIGARGQNLEGKRVDLGAALRAAAYFGYKEMVQWLLSLSMDVNAKNRAGYTALMSASAAGHLNIIKMLLEVDDIDYRYMAKDRESMVSVAANPDIVKFMVEEGLLEEKEVSRFVDEAEIQRNRNRKGIVNSYLAQERCMTKFFQNWEG